MKRPRGVRVAVCEAPAELEAGDRRWRRLARQVRRARPHLLVLNEMPFGRWVAGEPRRDRRLLQQIQQLHRDGIDRLAELGAPVVLGTRAAQRDGRSLNEGFVWETDRGLRVLHTKQFFPDEAGYYETRWFERGDSPFRVREVLGLRVGFLICTDVWFLEWARHYGKQGAHLIVVPRATPRPSLERWKMAIATAALVSGCYVASSNRVGRDRNGQVFGGGGWIVRPDGRMIAATSAHKPVVVAAIDRALAAKAKREYPRYVKELSPS